MPKNKILRFFGVCLACVVLIACKQDKQKGVTNIDKKADPQALESELHILALNGRIESGKNNPDIDWVTPFENATGCKVQATLVENNLLLGSSMGNQNVDLVISTESATTEFMQPLDTSRLRSYKELDKRFLVQAVATRIFALPFQWQLIKPVSPETEIVTQVESTYLLANAKNINCAYAWMEWSLSPKVQADIAASLGTIPVVPAACVGNEALGDDACKQRMSEVVVPESQVAPAEVPAETKTP